MEVNGMHFSHTSNLKKIPDDLLTAVHRQTRNISKHVPVDGGLEIAFPEVKRCFEIFQGSWIFSEIFLDIFVKVPVVILVKHIKQKCELFIDVTPLAFIVQCSLGNSNNNNKKVKLSTIVTLVFVNGSKLQKSPE